MLIVCEKKYPDNCVLIAMSPSQDPGTEEILGLLGEQIWDCDYVVAEGNAAQLRGIVQAEQSCRRVLNAQCRLHTKHRVEMCGRFSDGGKPLGANLKTSIHIGKRGKITQKETHLQVIFPLFCCRFRRN